jgi:hypothetical protein
MEIKKRGQVETSGDKLARLLKLRKRLMSGVDSWLSDRSSALVEFRCPLLLGISSSQALSPASP